MKEMIQAGNFYDSLEEKDKKELTEATSGQIAAKITGEKFFEFLQDS